MTISSASFSVSAAATANQAIAEIKTGSLNRTAILELSILIHTASGGWTAALGRSIPARSTASTSSRFLLHNLAESPSNSVLISAWSSRPIFDPALALIRRHNGATGSVWGGVIWTFPRGLVVTPTSSIVLWSLSSGSFSANINVTVEE